MKQTNSDMPSVAAIKNTHHIRPPAVKWEMMHFFLRLPHAAHQTHINNDMEKKKSAQVDDRLWRWKQQNQSVKDNMKGEQYLKLFFNFIQVRVMS